MQQTGVRIDTDYVKWFDSNLEVIKESLFPLDEDGNPTPFNPRSPDQILAWARSKGLSLASASRKDVRKLLEKTAGRYGYGSVENLLDADDEGKPEELLTLQKLDQYKDSGKGLTSWFSPEHVDKNGIAHPRFISVGAGTGRLSSSKPNFQNVVSRGWGKVDKGDKESKTTWGNLVKGAITAPDFENYDIVDADLGQLELRSVLFMAGYPIDTIKGDALTKSLEESKEHLLRASEITKTEPRDILKTVVYGGQYGEGVQIYTPEDLRSPVTKRQLERGAIRLYTPEYVKWLDQPWEYAGGVIGFTGANLAERLFGDKREESRRKALEIQDDIIFAGDLRIIREWQIKVSRQIEVSKFLQLPNTHGLRMLGSPHKNFKVGLAFLGQGFGAMHAQATMLEMIRRTESLHLPLLQVHDSLVYAVSRDWPDQQVREFMVPFFSETPLIPGFKAPGKVKRGRNYGSYHAEHNPGGLRQIWDSSKEDVCGNKL
jgi:hypothetical protein